MAVTGFAHIPKCIVTSVGSVISNTAVSPYNPVHKV